MSMKVARKAIDFCDNYDGSLTIGGGEPTLHPYFWSIIGECLGSSNIETIWMATNGSKTDIALRLANMAKKGIMGVALSQDEWHDEIDEKVIEAFKSKTNLYSKENNDYREIRTVKSLINVGRAKANDLYCEEKQTCAGDDWFIKPNGDLRQCGCSDSPILGNFLVDSFEDIYEKMEKIRKENGDGDHPCCHAVKEDYSEEEYKRVNKLMEEVLVES